MRTPFVEFIEKRIGKNVAEVFELNQMLLPQEERMRPEGKQCYVRAGSLVCTLPDGHKGRHIAHNLLGNIVGRWDF